MSDSDSDGSMDLDGLYDTVVRTGSFLFTVCTNTWCGRSYITLRLFSLFDVISNVTFHCAPFINSAKYHD